jgi:lysyl-tRNA synthetase class 1
MMPEKAKDTTETPDWAAALADQVIEAFPDQETYVGAAGISPSGPVHFGNFRDVSVTLSVLEAISQRGKPTRFVYSWDDWDRFRKVPAGVPEEWQEHVGKPLSAVPDPEGQAASYAERFERQFEADMAAMGIELDYIRQTEQYAAGNYDHAIITALQNREKIARVLFDLMSEKSKQANGLVWEEYREAYYPVSVYSPETGRDFTTVTGYDGEKTLTYLDKESKQEHTLEIGKDHNLKLTWKVDWPMRWAHEGVNFEPAGMDHASPGSSFDAGDRIIQEVYGATPPVHTAYGFIGIQGEAGKMSGSSGTGVTIGQLLEVYEPELLKWLYARKQPKQYFSLAFDTEIYRQYDEYDRTVVGNSAKPMPFRQAVAFGQIVSWNADKVEHITGAIGESYDAESVESRLPRAKNWLETYNPDQKFQLRDAVNTDYVATLDDVTKAQVVELRQRLSDQSLSVEQLNEVVYGIPKDDALDEAANKPRQRQFFTHVYQLLIGQDTGPRLSTFLWAADRKRVLNLLDINQGKG